MEYMSAHENVGELTIWELKPDFHSIITHFEGVVSSFTAEIEGGPARAGAPVPGESWIVPMNVRYFAETRLGTARYGVLRLAPDALARVTGGEQIARSLTPQLGVHDPFIFHVVGELDRVFRGQDDMHIMYAKHLMVAACCYIFDRFSDKAMDNPSTTAAASSTAVLLDSFIRDNLSEPLRLEDLASLANLPPKQFLGAFKKLFGVTPTQYIIRTRVEAARYLLRDRKRDITDIALSTGFSSHAHFSMTFKKHTGVSPSEFRSLQN